MKTLREAFITPDEDYTPYPFWFWNGELSHTEIKKQIHDFFAKGIHGFVIHPRMGIPKEIPYLSEQFFSFVKTAVEQATELNMKVILYDEGMYPSGSANGHVVRTHPEYASKGIYVTRVEDYKKDCKGFRKVLFFFKWINQTVFEVATIEQATHVLVHEDSGGTIRGIHFGEDDGEVSAPPSADLLNPKACRLFIDYTHEEYFKHLSPYFGNTIQGFFTDEPAILGRNHHSKMRPYNEYLAEKLKKIGIGMKDLPKLFLDNPERQKITEKYQSCVTDQLEESYYQPISNWCTNHQIYLTGHPHDAHDIGLLKYFHLPGQDVVWRWIGPEDELGIKGRESVTGKSASDAARHAQRERNANECFGCCGSDGNQWSFSADEMKWYLDWLFVRGCNFIIPHAFFYSLEGKRKEDRAPDVGRNNLWWPHYHYFTDYIKRMSYMMSQQYNLTNIAVICEKTHLPYEGIEVLYQNQMEFNYLEVDYLLANQFNLKDEFLCIAKQKYNVLFIEDRHPDLEFILLKLQKFQEVGGQVFIINEKNSFESYLEDLKLQTNRLVEMKGETRALRYTEFIKEEQQIIGLSNEGDETLSFDIFCSPKYQTVQIWNPWKGKITPQSINKGSVSLVLNRREFIFLTFEETVQSREKTRNKRNKQLDYTFKTSPIPLKNLESWTKEKKTRFYSGTITYDFEFFISKEEYDSLPKLVQLDLGRVENIVTIFVDGEEKETLFWSPYQFTLSKDSLFNKQISFEVTNTLANEMDRVPLESGLLGPIEINY
ncbi:glycosyl hydrolase [Enterococcus lemanii]|uniref:Glycosyl hydrolase n=1 Tax=Enterococcus lemanii TaxID=1159752 RepID=A0ABV9MW92_9ENTE|nr:glycosyl hydrolase [Enterococcus lemanii]MBM7708259.1 hypothetical protein [Enterococcus lemanii]